MHVPGKKGEGIQRSLNWEGQWGWFMTSRECQGRAGPRGFFSRGWLLWASTQPWWSSGDVGLSH